MDLGLSGRRVVVTASTSGIGRAVALRLAAEGCQLILGGRTQSQLDTVAEQVRHSGGRAVTICDDMSTASGLEALVSRGVAEFGGLDSMVCTVGGPPGGAFEDLPDLTWNGAFEGKFMATIRAIRVALPQLRLSMQPKVVVVAGNSCYDPAPTQIVSAVLNAALGAMVSSLGRDYAPEHLGFVCVDPGLTDTNRLRNAIVARMEATGMTESDTWHSMLSAIPTGRIAAVDEIAIVIALSLSPLVPQLTGARIVVDGAQTWSN